MDFSFSNGMDKFSEGHPTNLCDKYKFCNMGAIIPSNRKLLMLPFIKKNLGNISQREIARRLGIGKTTINKWSSEMGYHCEKHTVNEQFFDELNETSAYVLGYIFADGNINWNPEKSYRALTITASEKDLEHLDRIRKALSSTKPLLYSEKTKSYRLIVNNKEICKKLIRIGIVPRKSLIVNFPKIRKNLLRHFIRGIIDGDGNVRYVRRDKSPYFEITISSGSPNFLSKLIGVIERYIGIKTKMRKIGNNVYLAQYSCTRGEKLADWIYKDQGDNLMLTRKFLPYQHLKFAKEVVMSHDN